MNRRARLNMLVEFGIKAPHMNILEREDGNVTIVEPLGDLTDKDIRQFDEKTAELLKAKQPRYVVIDLGEVDHVSAAGLRSLLMLSKRLRASAGKLALCALKDRVREAFDISGITEAFLIAASPQEAITLLRSEKRRSSAIPRPPEFCLPGIGPRGGVPQPGISDSSHHLAGPEGIRMSPEGSEIQPLDEPTGNLPRFGDAGEVPDLPVPATATEPPEIFALRPLSRRRAVARVRRRGPAQFLFVTDED